MLQVTILCKTKLLLQCAGAKSGIIFKMFFSLIRQIFLKKKTRDKSYFPWAALLFKHFFIQIKPNMSEQEKETTKNLWFA